MSSWRDHILQKFVPGAARLTLVADPDNLLLDEDLLQEIRARRFELIPFEDPVAFRYVYESRFRSHWDRNEETELAVVLRLPSSPLDRLPYDLLQAGRKLSFSLAELFPNLNYSVVAALDRTDLDKLYEAQKKQRPGLLGENATKDFILRYVFGIVPEAIGEPADLLRVLLRFHYRQQRIPEIIARRLNELLCQNTHFQDWPLEEILTDSRAFFSFLQERWPVFLDWIAEPAKVGSVQDPRAHYGLKLPGPALLPFDHEDVRVYVDNLFLDGLLQPVSHPRVEQIIRVSRWVECGLRLSAEETRQWRIEKLLEALKNDVVFSSEDVRHEAWMHFASRWAELWALIYMDDSMHRAYHEQVAALRSLVDRRFYTWVWQRYASLINLPPDPPVMLHHIPHYLAWQLEKKRDGKIALLVMDGLALDQWIALRQELEQRNAGFRFREATVFAWIPTITPVCRGAVFAGTPPLFFPESIQTTAREPHLWAKFWAEQSLKQEEVAYEKGLDEADRKRLIELLDQPGLRVVGLVVNKVDRIMHGMELGAAGMHNQVRQWARNEFLAELLLLLLERGFSVYLTSDHGNIEASGIDSPREGVVADVRGERVRVYPDAGLRARVKAQFPDALEWPPIGLPENYLPLIAPGRAAFVQSNRTVVAHGGISLEELIVPFVQVEK